MRTQGWWLNVAKRNERGTYSHYCSIWLGDNRVGTEEKKKAREIKQFFQSPDTIIDGTWSFTLSEEWISGKEHPI